MNGHDRRHWATAHSLADLAELTAQWCEGHLTQTPGHAGPPARETLPYLGLLATVNRAGFVTENSQAAKPGSTAWVCGFAAPGTAGRLEAAAAGTRLAVTGMPWRPRRAMRYLYGRACPHARQSIRRARIIWLEDPDPDRNDLLWPVLAAFAAGGHRG